MTDIVVGGTAALEVVAPAAYLDGSSGVARLDLVTALADATAAGEAVNVETKAADFTAAIDSHYEANAAAGAIIATIPAASAANAGHDIIIARVDATANALTAASVSTINGDAIVSIVFQNSALTIRSTGAMWRIV